MKIASVPLDVFACDGAKKSIHTVVPDVFACDGAKKSIHTAAPERELVSA